LQKNLSKQALYRRFEKIFGCKPEIVVRAAGRVNLIGEHTDYNDGFVLPAAINRSIYFVAAKRENGNVRAYAEDFDSMSTFPLTDDSPDPKHRWNIYLKGVIQLLQKRGITFGGVDVLIAADLPRASGLSSSAAMEVGTASMFQTLYPYEIDELELVKLIQQAEHQYAGTKCGIMDMFICRMGRKDHALFLDCRTLDFKLVPTDLGDVSIVICDSRKKRGLADSAYNERRSQCEEGVKLLSKWLPGITALRDVTVDEFEKYTQKLPEIVQKRCRHIVYENNRVLSSVEALRQKNLAQFGNLLAESHASLRDLYEVSCQELDVLVEAADEVDGTIGARMTGAGFGGCTVNLVKETSLTKFKAHVTERFKQTFTIEPEIYVCKAEDGVKIEHF